MKVQANHNRGLMRDCTVSPCFSVGYGAITPRQEFYMKSVVIKATGSNQDALRDATIGKVYHAIRLAAGVDVSGALTVLPVPDAA